MNQIDEVFGDNITTGHNFSDGLYAKEIRILKGGAVTQHKHNYSHLSILAQGKVELYCYNEPTRIIDAPACLELKAGVNHSIKALEDSVWFCIHAVDTVERSIGDIEKRLIKEI